jgi:hypothetical protein
VLAIGDVKKWLHPSTMKTTCYSLFPDVPRPGYTITRDLGMQGSWVAGGHSYHRIVVRVRIPAKITIFSNGSFVGDSISSEGLKEDKEKPSTTLVSSQL